MKIETKFCIGQKIYFAYKTNHAVACKSCGEFLTFSTYAPRTATITSVTIDENGLKYLIHLYDDMYFEKTNEKELFKSAAAAIKGCEKLNWEARK